MMVGVRRVFYGARVWVVAGTAVLCMMPVLFIMLNSFMSPLEAGARYTSLVTPYSSFGVINSDNMHYMDMGLLPDVLTVSGWRQILLEDPTHLRYLWNSIILSVPVVLGNLVIAPLAAYGFERMRAKRGEKLFAAYVITMILPMQALLVPHFIAASFFGINGNYLAIILPAVFAPFGVFLIRQHLKGFEKEIIEAASVDGAGEFQIFRKMVLPNIKPTMIALTVLTFAEVWNIVDQAVVFIHREREMPMSVHLSTVFSGDGIGFAFAISSLFMIPALIVFIYGQDYIADGVGYSGIR